MKLDKFDLVEFKTNIGFGWNLVGKVIAVDPDRVYIEVGSDLGGVELFEVPPEDVVRIL